MRLQTYSKIDREESELGDEEISEYVQPQEEIKTARYSNTMLMKDNNRVTRYLQEPNNNCSVGNSLDHK